MDARKLDRWVETQMKRVMEGDDEALNVLLLELRPLALELIPSYARQGPVPLEVVAGSATAALYQALLLWSPAREPFIAVLERRVMESLRNLFLRAKDISEKAPGVEL